MKKVIIAILMIALMTTTTTALSTENNESGCTKEQIEEMRQAIINQNLDFDFNDDGKVNLSDIGLFAQQCYEEEPEEETAKKIVQPKRSRSIHVAKEKDGSYTFRTPGKIVQYPNNKMIVRRTGQWEGFDCWNYGRNKYCGNFFKAYGYNYANIKMVY